MDHFICVNKHESKIISTNFSKTFIIFLGLSSLVLDCRKFLDCKWTTFVLLLVCPTFVYHLVDVTILSE